MRREHKGLYISDVSVRLSGNRHHGKGVVAFAKVTLNNALVIEFIRLVEKDGRLIVSMPSKKGEHGFDDLVHPTETPLRSMIEDAVISAYKAMTVNE